MEVPQESEHSVVLSARVLIELQELAFAIGARRVGHVIAPTLESRTTIVA
jgi:hypothetical protein